MLLFSLVLSMALDMFLPEFQPDVDVSGNYIVSDYDVSGSDTSSNDSFVTFVSPDTVVLNNVESNSDDDIVSAINQLNEDNNNYWELFLDSYPIEINHSLGSTQLIAPSWFINTDSTVGSNNGNYRICYVPVISGVTYTISNIAVPSYNRYSYFVVDDIFNPTVVTNRGSLNPLTDPFSVTPSQDGYFCLQINYGNDFGSFVSQWITIEQDSYTLSELGNAVISIRDEFNIKFRAILFICLFIFLYPIAMSICKNIVGGKK